jgi:Asp-tRNA(Asn)/Glu-tRNA(Gln) amidotransferase A subunit family amidase
MDFSTKGPMGISIADVRLLLAIMAGPVAGDPTALPSGMPEGETIELPRRVFATPRFAPWGPLPAPVEELFGAALRTLESELDLSVVSMEPRDVYPEGNIDDDWFTIVAAEHARFLGREEIEANERLYSEEFASGVRAGLSVSIEAYLEARRRRFEYVRRLDELLGADGLLVSPTMCAEGWSSEGILPGASSPGTPGDAYNTQAANVTGHPALSVPAGRSPNGVPFGLQITGPRFRDELVLAMGDAWERAMPWPIAAPGYEPFVS